MPANVRLAQEVAGDAEGDGAGLGATGEGDAGEGVVAGGDVAGATDGDADADTAGVSLGAVAQPPIANTSITIGMSVGRWRGRVSFIGSRRLRDRPPSRLSDGLSTRV
jgi:hypothetical protein